MKEIEKLKKGSSGGGPEDWDYKQVADWVKSKGFNEREFERERIDGRALLRLTERKLEDDMRMRSREARDLAEAIEKLAKEGSRGGGSKELADMSVDDILDCLGNLGDPYKRLFRDQRWSGRAFMRMDLADLKSNGVSRADAEEIMDKIDALKKGGGGGSSRPKGIDSMTENEVVELILGPAGLERSLGRMVKDEQIDGRSLMKMIDEKKDWPRAFRKADIRDMERAVDDFKRKSGKDDRDRRDDDRNDTDRDRDRGGSTRDRDRDDGRRSVRDEPQTREITFQFGERNVSSTRQMECRTDETPHQICQKIHEKYLKTVQAIDMELVYNGKPLDPNRRTLGEIGVEASQRIVIRRRKK